MTRCGQGGAHLRPGAGVADAKFGSRAARIGYVVAVPKVWRREIRRVLSSSAAGCLAVATLSFEVPVWAGPPSGADGEATQTQPAPEVEPSPAPPAPLPDWSPYVGVALRFEFQDGTAFTGTLQRDDGETVLVKGTDGGLYSVDKLQVVRMEYVPTPAPTPAPAPAPLPASSDAQYQNAVDHKEAVKYELSRGESAPEYKQARGMLIGGAVMTGVGSLLALAGLTAAATGDLASSAGATPSGTQPVTVTGFALLGAGVLTLGAGIPLMVIGKKRKAEVTERVKRELSATPTFSRDGAGVHLGLSF